LLDEPPLPVGQAAGPGVHHGGSFLHEAVGVVDLFRHLVVTDVEVLQAALGLRAPVPAGEHLHIAEAVELPPRSGRIQPDG
jgi:hypothetical protein